MQTINNRLKQNFCKIKQYKIIKIHLKILQLKRLSMATLSVIRRRHDE